MTHSREKLRKDQLLIMSISFYTKTTLKGRGLRHGEVLTGKVFCRRLTSMVPERE